MIEKVTSRQFWHALTGQSAKCEFGDQTESLIMDAFIQKRNNKALQERLKHKTYEGRSTGKREMKLNQHSW